MSHSQPLKMRPGEKGSSLIEALIASLVLLLLMLGILSMFSMAYLVNLGASARTEMTYKAQQVAEALRYLTYVSRTSGSGSLPSSTDTGLAFPLSATANPVVITTLSGSTLQYRYWGQPSSTLPDAVGVVESPTNKRYEIAVSIAGPDASTGLVTVTIAVSPILSGSGPRYQGRALRRKEVDYVTQILP
jgi:hypothetical protein